MHPNLAAPPVHSNGKDRAGAGHHGTVMTRSLTDREAEVLRLLCDGLRNREIAVEMRIALKTVEAHMRSIYQKMGVRNRVQAALRGVGGFHVT